MKIYEPDHLPESVTDSWDGCLAGKAIGRLESSHQWFVLREEGDSPRGAVVFVSADGVAPLLLPLLHRPWPLRIALFGKTLIQRRVATLTVCGGEVIGDDVTAERLGRVWRELAVRYPDAEAIRLEHVPAAAIAAVRASAQRAGGYALHRAFPEMPHYYLRLPPTWQAYCQSRSKRSIKRLERYERSLAQQLGAPLRIREIRTEADVARFGATIERLVNATWQAATLGHTLRLADHMSAVRHGFFRSFLLVAGETPLAFQLSYQGNGVLLLYQTGYDREYAKYGPGAILMHRLVECLYGEENRPRYIDFGVGESPQKQAAADTTEAVNDVLLFRARFRLRLWFGLAAACGRLERFLRWAAARLGISRRSRRGVGSAK